MVVEVIFVDIFLMLLLYGLVHGLVRRWPPRWLRHPASPTPSKGCAKAKPFPGLTKKPHCAACEAAAGAHPRQPPGPPPPVIHYRSGRPREVDTYNHYCPNNACEYYGWIGRGNIRANGLPNRRRWRQLHCVACDRYFLETHGTVFHGKNRPAEDILRAIAAVAEGLGIRAVARVFETEPSPVSKLWLAVQVGDRTHAMAQRLVHQVVARLAAHCRPLFITDGFKEYATALLAHVGQWVQPPRRRNPAGCRNPRYCMHG